MFFVYRPKSELRFVFIDNVKDRHLLFLVGTSALLFGFGAKMWAAPSWEAAARARARGIRLALCTGRPAFGLARGFAERLDGGGWHVFQNGASVVRLPGVASPLPADLYELVKKQRG